MTTKTNLSYFVPLFKSVKNDQHYIEYGKRMQNVDNIMQGVTVVMDGDAFQKNKTIMKDCRIIVFKKVDATSQVTTMNAVNRNIIYQNCSIEFFEEKAINVVMQSFDNNVENIIVMGSGSLFKQISSKYAFNTILLTVYERKLYGNIAHYEAEREECENNLDRFDHDILTDNYILENMVGKDEYEENSKEKIQNLRYTLKVLCHSHSLSHSHNETQYISLVKDILQNGNLRTDRTNVGTLSLFGKQLKFDISHHIPILTTKKIAWKTVIKELLWFLSGSTDSKVLEKQGVNIWKGNTSRSFLDSRNLKQYTEGDIGPLYPFSLRHYNAKYQGCERSYKGKGFDQWTNLIHGLKSDPFSRRHLMTTFNPSVTHECVLPPCHGIAIQFYVEELPSSKRKEERERGRGLRCHVYCRSSDVFLGLPFNIASYSILTYIVAEICDMTPLELIMSLGDAHIYKNHMEQINQQIERVVLSPPILLLNHSNIKNKDISEVTVDDFELKGYFHHSFIKAEMAV